MNTPTFDIYQLSNFQIFLVFFIPICAFSTLGYWLLANRIETILRDGSETRNEVVGNFLNILAMVFGIMLGLVAVGVWEKYDSSEAIVDKEATMALLLFRMTSGLPDSTSQVIHADISQYLHDVIDLEWPEAKSGKLPLAGLKSLQKLQQHLMSYHPVSEHNSIVYALCLEKFADFFEARRARVYATTSGLSPIIWMVSILGIICTIVITWFFRTTMRMHLIMSVIVSLLTASILFMIASLDWPFRSREGITTSSYELSLEVIDRVNQKQF